MANKWQYFDTLDSIGKEAAAITPVNGQVLTNIPKYVYIGTGGDVTCRAVNSTADVVYKNLPDGSILPCVPQIIHATGTTAADFVGHY